LCQRDGAVILPFAGSFDVIDEDEEIIRLAFVVDFGDLVISASHFDRAFSVVTVSGKGNF
jgi:hypothetical protein